jgi:putative nucleotidyltransferase with HDIG domain
VKRVLFVDDEQQVLDGLKDLLRKQRKVWEMVFALGGEQALVELERSPFDVVVSDMKMPGLDGAQLLARVKQAHPATARIILSGYAERDAVINALPVAHQFLSKPCNVDVLRDVVERTCSLETLLRDERVRSAIGQLDRLPSAPQAYWDLTQSIADSSTSLAQVAEIVERDGAMAAKILQLVNSAYFAVAQKQTSLTAAVAYLGTDLLKALTLTAHVFSLNVKKLPGFDLEALQEHSLRVARIAKRFFDEKAAAAEAFTAAVVHDIGKIVLASSVPERYADVLAGSRGSIKLEHEKEVEILGVSHAEVGAYLLGLWGLPLGIVEGVAYHHRPEFFASSELLCALHVADALVHESTETRNDSSAGSLLAVEAVESSPWGAKLPKWRACAEAERAKRA